MAKRETEPVLTSHGNYFGTNYIPKETRQNKNKCFPRERENTVSQYSIKQLQEQEYLIDMSGRKRVNLS